MIDIALERAAPLVADPACGHNRWHPEIEPIATVRPGEIVSADTRDGIDGQIDDGSTPADVLRLDMNRGHPMTGPFFVQGAEAGDLLEIETLAIEPADFGFTVVRPGTGLLGDEFAEPFVVRWRVVEGVARSRDLPGVAIRGEPFIGLIGVAPGPRRLRSFAERERELLGRGGAVRPPDPVSAVPADGPAATDGLRTVPPRENGGNLDIKQLTVGSILLLPVQVPGALLSLGDVHFAQGDGECCSQAIEMRARVRFRVGLRRRGELDWRPTQPALEFAEPPRSSARRCVATTGIPVDEGGRNHDMDVRMAARVALREMLGLITGRWGLTREQAYALASVAVDLRISEVVNVPNALVTAVLPLDVFEELHQAMEAA